MVNPAPALLRGRAAAESMMVDTCLIRRVTGKTTDPETGVVTPIYTTIYAGKCKVQALGSQGQAPARPHDLGQAQVFVQPLELHVPTSVTGILADDLVTITASVLDPDLPGKAFHARALSHKTFLTARRFMLEEILS